MAVKRNTVNRPSQSHLQYVTTKDGRRLLNLAYKGSKSSTTNSKSLRPNLDLEPVEKPTRKLKYHLHAIDADNNANKEYRIYENPDGTVTAEWGRVGAAKLQSKDYAAGEAEKLRKKKLRGGYQEAQTILTDDIDGTSVSNSDFSSLNPTGDKEISRMLNHFQKVNKHEIETFTGGSIKIDSDGIARTSMGVITDSSLVSAQDILNKDQISKDDAVKFLSYVPQKVKTVSSFADELQNNSAFRAQQQDLLRQLESGMQLYKQRAASATSKVASTAPKFKHSIVPLDSGDRAKYEKLFNDHIRVGHTNSPTRPKIKNVFGLNDHQSTLVDELKSKGERARLAFHGTAPGNCLSLSTGGLKGPADLAKAGVKPRVTGAMFSNLEHPSKKTSGTGVYLAQTKIASDGSSFGKWGGPPNAASKSLGYTSGGAWLSRATGDRYMFVVEAYTGRECRSTPSDTNSSVVRRYKSSTEYDSLVIKGGEASVRNDEMVVPSSRCRIVAIIEIA